MTNQKGVDTPSQQNKFGWVSIGDDLSIPVIIRSNGVRYCPTRIVEQVIIKKYSALPQNVFTCITLKSFYLTQSEARLMTDINVNHCDQYYGADFFSIQDVIISANDVKQLSRYLNVAKRMYTKNFRDCQYHGLVKVVIDPTNPNLTITVPFIRKSYNNDRSAMFVPSKLVETFVDLSSLMIKGHPTDWDIMYFKMLHYFSTNGAHHLDLTVEDRIIPINESTYASSRTPIITQNCD